MSLSPAELRFERRVLEAIGYAGRVPVSRSAIAGIRDVEVLADSVADQLLVTMSRDVYRHQREVIESEVDSWSVEVPWQVSLMVEVPRGFWRRLFRRPARKIWTEASGRVEHRGRVVNRQTEFAAFPDLPEDYYPPVFGQLVVHQVWDQTLLPRLDLVQVVVEDGVAGSAAEAGWRHPWRTSID